MQAVSEFIGIIAFFVAYKMYDIYVATAVAIVASIAQIAWLKYNKQSITKMQFFNLGAIVLFGGLTIGLHDKSFIMVKPTIIYWSFAAILAVSWFIFKKNLIQAVMGKEISLQPAVEQRIWSQINLYWIAYFLALGALNWYIATHFSEEFWVNFKFSTIGILIVFIIIQGIWLAKHMEKPAE